MVYNFCTYFDKNYLLKGLALHNSLLEHCENFHLWILCFDDTAYKILEKLNLKNVDLIKLSDFEDQKLLAVKSGRKISEYCWTCTPALPLYILKQNPDLDTIAYLDADLYFYNSPEKIYEEFGDNSIMIIPHNFSEDQKWREKTSGTYNVGMLIFRNDQNALECLNWWRERCLEWCFDYYEDGKLGDQLYLNNWPEKFKKVLVLKNEGANVASWNIKKYDLYEKDNKIVVQEKSLNNKWFLIFYHFHGITVYNVFNKLIAKKQDASNNTNKIVFKKYSKTLTSSFRRVKTVYPKFDYGLQSGIKYYYRIIKSTLQQLTKVII